MPGNITRDASRAGDKVRSVRERGNKLPGKLRYTSVSIHRRDSHVREGRRPVNRARKLKSSTAAAVKPTRRARARAGGEKARTNDDVTPGRGGAGGGGGAEGELSFARTIAGAGDAGATNKRAARNVDIKLGYLLHRARARPRRRASNILEYRARSRASPSPPAP